MINEGEWLLTFIVNLQGITIMAIILEEMCRVLIAQGNLKKEIKYIEVK